MPENALPIAELTDDQVRAAMLIPARQARTSLDLSSISEEGAQSNISFGQSTADTMAIAANSNSDSEDDDEQQSEDNLGL